MGKRVTVECTECGATHRVLADRLGQSRPCPKCGVEFILDEESTKSTYGLSPGAASDDPPAVGPDWNDEDFAPDPEPLPRRASVEEQPESDVPMLKRGIHREPATWRRKSTENGDFLKNPKVIIAGVVGCVLLGFLLHLATRPGGDPQGAPDGSEPPSETSGSATLE